MNRKNRLRYLHSISQNVERKKMYKAKKQWIVAGVSFLVATGLGAVSSNLTTHADVNQISTQTQKHPVSNSSANSGFSTTKPVKSASTKLDTVQSSATNMYRGLMLRATYGTKKNDNHQHSASNSYNVSNSVKLKANQVSSLDVDNINLNGKASGPSSLNSNNQSFAISADQGLNTNSLSSSSVSANKNKLFNSAYQSYMDKMGNIDDEIMGMNVSHAASTNRRNNGTNIKNRLLNGSPTYSSYFTGESHSGNDLGINYISYASGGLEFTNGLASGDVTNFGSNADLQKAQAIKIDGAVNMTATDDSNQNGGPFSNLKNAKSIQFDNKAQIPSYNGMFANDVNLESVIIPSNVSLFDGYMGYNLFPFANDSKVQSITIPSSSNIWEVVFPRDASVNKLNQDNSEFTPLGSLLSEPQQFGTYSDKIQMLTEGNSELNSAAKSAISDITPKLYYSEVNSGGRTYLSPIPMDLGDSDVNNGTYADSGYPFLGAAAQINYQVGGNTIASTTVSTSSDKKGTDITNFPNVPSGYHIAQGLKIPIDDNIHNVNLIPNAINIQFADNYGNNNYTKKNINTQGCTQDNYIIPQNMLPNNYQVANNTSTIPNIISLDDVSDGGTAYINIEPNPVTGIITFHDIYGNIDGKQVPPSETERGESSSDYYPSIPSGWALVNSDGTSAYVSDIKYGVNKTLDVAPSDEGLIYKYKKANSSIEFTNGNPNYNLSNFSSNNDIRDAESITFDSDINTSDIGYVNNMLSGDKNLKYLKLGNNFNTTSLSSMNQMLSNLPNLQTLIIQSSNTKFNNQVGLPPMYKVDDLGYTSKVPVNLEDNQSHVGTWLTKPNLSPIPAMQSSISSLSSALSHADKIIDSNSAIEQWRASSASISADMSSASANSAWISNNSGKLLSASTSASDADKWVHSNSNSAQSADSWVVNNSQSENDASNNATSASNWIQNSGDSAYNNAFNGSKQAASNSSWISNNSGSLSNASTEANKASASANTNAQNINADSTNASNEANTAQASAESYASSYANSQSASASGSVTSLSTSVSNKDSSYANSLSNSIISLSTSSSSFASNLSNRVIGTETLHLVYNINHINSNGDSSVIATSYSNAYIPINTSISNTSEVISPWTYTKDYYNVPLNNNLYLSFNQKNNTPYNNLSYNRSDTFTYNATQAGNVVVNYYDVDNDMNTSTIPIKSDNLGNFDGLVGQQITLTTSDVGTGNGIYGKLNVPKGYHLAHQLNTITLQAPNQKASSQADNKQNVGLVLMAPVVKNNSDSNTNKPVKAVTTNNSSSNQAQASEASNVLMSNTPNLNIIPATSERNHYVSNNNTRTTNTSLQAITARASHKLDEMDKQARIVKLVHHHSNKKNESFYIYIHHAQVPVNKIPKVWTARQLNKVNKDHTIRFGRVIVTNLSGRHSYEFRILKHVYLHKRIYFTHGKFHSLKPSHKALRINRIFLVQQGKHTYIRLELKLDHHIYFITGKKHYVQRLHR